MAFQTEVKNGLRVSCIRRGGRHSVGQMQPDTATTGLERPRNMSDQRPPCRAPISGRTWQALKHLFFDSRTRVRHRRSNTLKEAMSQFGCAE
jgi:hypothetical protein